MQYHYLVRYKNNVASLHGCCYKGLVTDRIFHFIETLGAIEKIEPRL